MTVQFQILSDLHLELDNQYSTYTIRPAAPYLILVGDIGSLYDYQPYLGFLRRHTLAFKQVYLLLGNHEFHHLSYYEALTRARQLETEDGLRGKLTLLNRTRVNIGESLIMLGCTLWSSIPPSARQVIKAKVKDYQHITDWTVDIHNAEHNKDVEWLRQQLRQSQEDTAGRSVLVVTHHAPSNLGTSNPMHACSPWSAAFSTPLFEGEAGDWVGIELVKCWVFGHTHWTTETEICGVRAVSNQRGYVRGTIGSKSGLERTEGSARFEKHTFDEARTIWI